MTALIESWGKPITDWSYPGKYKQIQAYADAKLLALMYTYAQARRHQGEGLTFNAVSPGVVKTTLGSKAGGPFKIIEALTNPFVGPPEKGSRGCVRLMADPELATGDRGLLQLCEVEEVVEEVSRPRGPGAHLRPDRTRIAPPTPEPAVRGAGVNAVPRGPTMLRGIEELAQTIAQPIPLRWTADAGKSRNSIAFLAGDGELAPDFGR